MDKNTIAIGSDHGGFVLKGKVVKFDNKDSFLDTLFGGTNE